MYTNPAYLGVRNLKERSAIIAILADISKLKEKGILSSGAQVSFKAKSPKFTLNAQRLLVGSLKNVFSAIDMRFNSRAGVIIATVTPK